MLTPPSPGPSSAQRFLHGTSQAVREGTCEGEHLNKVSLFTE